jgi:hypothetical protein
MTVDQLLLAFIESQIVQDGAGNYVLSAQAEENIED